jgi:hypothetical protein
MTQPLPRPFVLAALVLAALLGISEASAQVGGAADPHAGIPGMAAAERVRDVPEGPARILGRIVHRNRPEAGADIGVALFALESSGRAGIRRTTTGSDGRFAFENIANDPDTVYLIGLRYADIPFGDRIVFEAGQLEHRTEIEVADTSRDTAQLEVGATRLRIDRGCSGIRVTERHELKNGSDFVLHVPPAQRAGAAPLFRIPLPAGARYFTADPTISGDDEGLEQRGNEVFFYGPLHPGQNSVEFSYSLAAEAGSVTVERRFPSGSENVRVLTWEGSPAAKGEGLAAGDAVRLGSLRYDAVESGAVPPGGSVRFAVDAGATAAGTGGLSLAELQVWLELDDAALEVREKYTVAVRGDEALESGSDAPLLCLAVPEEAQDMRFSADTFAKGVQPDATGGLALRGPFPAGESSFALSYLVPNRANGARFERTLPTDLSLLSMFIADTGVLTETDRLHRRRPIEAPDRMFLQLEGFQIAAGAAVSTASADERAAVYAAIRDLEDDFETGKISAEDHGEMLAELRSRAAVLLRAEREGEAGASGEPAAPAAASFPSARPETTAAAGETPCPGCGAPLAAGVRFCPQCGEQTTPPADARDAPA